MKRILHIAKTAVVTVLFSFALLCGCASQEHPDAAVPGAQEQALAPAGEQSEDPGSRNRTAGEELPTDTPGAGDGASGGEDDGDGYDDGDREKDESPAVGYLVADHEKTFEGIKQYLSEISAEPSEFAKEGGLAISWNGVAGMRNLVAFEKRCEAGEEAEIALMQYTDEGDPILQYLCYDGTEVWCVQDNSRDKWRGSGDPYWEVRYPFLLSFTQKAEERDRMHTIILSKKDGLSYDECTQAFSEGGSGGGMPAVLFIASFFYTDADL